MKDNRLRIGMRFTRKNQEFIIEKPINEDEIQIRNVKTNELFSIRKKLVAEELFEGIVEIIGDSGQALELMMSRPQWLKVWGLDIINSGRPMQNGFIEPFNRSYREAGLNMYIFETLEDVKTETERWLGVYNQHRLHEALGNLTPIEYLQKFNPETVL